MKVSPLKLGALAMLTTLTASIPAEAALVSIFSYEFPASYSGTSSVLVDQSGAGNNGTIDAPSTGGYLSADRPSGFASGGSLTGASGGHGRTDAVGLLKNSALQSAGGFTMDTWFRWEGTYTNTRKLIDYAGTEYLRTFDSKIQFVLSNAATVLTSTNIIGGQWYHVRAEFDSTGNIVDGNGDLAGTARLYLDGALVDSVLTTKTSFGDSLNRPIGINRWGGGGADWNQGAIFNPSVSLGVVPEPSVGILALLSSSFLLFSRRRNRRG